MKYKIEIHAMGYEDTAKVVDRQSRNRITKNDILEAKVEWINHNALDVDDCEMPFHRITKL